MICDSVSTSIPFSEYEENRKTRVFKLIQTFKRTIYNLSRDNICSVESRYNHQGICFRPNTIPTALKCIPIAKKTLEISCHYSFCKNKHMSQRA